MISQAIRLSRARTRVGHRAGLGVCRRARAGDERERHAVDLGVFGLEMPVVVGGVAHPPQGAADDLLAEELRAEGADAEDVGDGVGVPAFGEHRDADDALDVLAELAGLADGVHDFAEQVFVGEVSASRPGKRARYSALNSSISRAAIFLNSALIASPDSSCSLSTRIVFGRCSPAAVLLVAEERQAGRELDDRSRSPIGFLPAGDVVEDQLRDVGVVADDDEDGRRDAAGPGVGVLLPERGSTSRSCRRGSAAPLAARREASARRRPLRSCALSWEGRSRMRSQRSR